MYDRKMEVMGRLNQVSLLKDFVYFLRIQQPSEPRRRKRNRCAHDYQSQLSRLTNQVLFSTFVSTVPGTILLAKEVNKILKETVGIVLHLNSTFSLSHLDYKVLINDPAMIYGNVSDGNIFCKNKLQHACHLKEIVQTF